MYAISPLEVYVEFINQCEPNHPTRHLSIRMYKIQVKKLVLVFDHRDGFQYNL